MYKKVISLNMMEVQKVSKVTGMLIDLEILDLDEIIEILENKESLVGRVKEALEVIIEAEKNKNIKNKEWLGPFKYLTVSLPLGQGFSLHGAESSLVPGTHLLSSTVRDDLMS